MNFSVDVDFAPSGFNELFEDGRPISFQGEHNG
jgi:hypothetical protein